MTESYANPGRGGGSYKGPHNRHQNSHNRHNQPLSNGPNSSQQQSRAKYPQYSNQPFPSSHPTYNNSNPSPSPHPPHKTPHKHTPPVNSTNPPESHPTHPVGFSKGAPSPDDQQTDENLVNDVESHVGSNSVTRTLDSPAISPVDSDPSQAPFPPQNTQPGATNAGVATQHTPTEDASSPTHPFPPSDSIEPTEPLLSEPQPKDTPVPIETDGDPPSVTPPPSNPQSETSEQVGAPGMNNQMNAMMGNMYMNSMFMNPWMGMMPWMPFYSYQGMQSLLQAQAQAQVYQQTQPYPSQYQQQPSPDAPLLPQEKSPSSTTDPFLSSESPSNQIPLPPPDTPELMSQTENPAPAPETSGETGPPASPPASNTSPTHSSNSLSSSRQPAKLSHSSLTDEPLNYDSPPSYPPDPAQDPQQLASHPDMEMGQLGVTVGSSALANCTNFENWHTFSAPMPARHQVMQPKQIPSPGNAPGIISSAVLQVQQTHQTFGPFSPAPLSNPPPSTNPAFSIRPGASNAAPRAPAADPHSGPKSTALSTEAAPQPSGFDNNTTAEPRNQHGIVEKVETSSESEQSNEDDLYFNEQEPTFLQLEVGGRTFQVHASTFDLYPDSKLYKIIHYAEAGCQNLSGAYTFDRDGSMFEVILSFARTGRLDLPPYFSLKAIEREAEFFGMKEYMFGQGKQISPGSYFSFRRGLKLDMELQPGNDRQFQCIAVLDSVDTLTFEEVVCEGFCHLLMEAVDLTGILIGRKIIFDNQDPNAWKGTQHSYEQKPVTVYLILIRKPSGGQPANSVCCKASITYSTVFTFDTESHLPGFYRR